MNSNASLRRCLHGLAFGLALAAGPAGAADLTWRGPIAGAELADLAKALQVPDPAGRLVVDSPGGYSHEARALAYRLRDAGWSLVVNGRCYSACATYWFAAAKTKTVLPGSFVVIHSSSVRKTGRGGRATELSGNEILDGIARAKISDEKYAQMMGEIYASRQFNNAIGVVDELKQAFDDYTTRRKRFLGLDNVNDYPGTPECPRLLGWALNKRQLEQNGVKGIGEFWFPRTVAEQNLVYRTLPYPPGSIYFGERAQLQRYCKGAPLNWWQRTWLRLTSEDKPVRPGSRMHMPM